MISVSVQQSQRAPHHEASGADTVADYGFPARIRPPGD